MRNRYNKSISTCLRNKLDAWLYFSSTLGRTELAYSNCGLEVKSDLKNFIFSLSTLEGLIAVRIQNLRPVASPSFKQLLDVCNCLGFPRLKVKCFLDLFLGGVDNPMLFPVTEILCANLIPLRSELGIK